MHGKTTCDGDPLFLSTRQHSWVGIFLSHMFTNSDISGLFFQLLFVITLVILMGREYA